jgi:hypothetical protein
MVTTYWTTGADAGQSSLTVWRWAHHTLHPVLTLEEPDGAIAASTHGPTLTVTGAYMRPGQCMACASPDRMTIRYRDGRWRGSVPGYMAELLTGSLLPSR